MTGEGEKAYELGSNPVEKSLNFYSLYYLSEVEEYEGSEEEFGFFVSNLAECFKWYGVLSICSELSSGALFLDLPAFIRNPEEGATDERVQIFTFNEQGGDIKELASYIAAENSLNSQEERMLVNMLSYREGVNFHPQVDSVEKAQRILNNADVDGAISNVKEFTRKAESIFGLPYWADNMAGTFGGSQWQSVCRYVRKFDEYSDTLYVDTGFGVEHNSGEFIDKVEYSSRAERISNSIPGVSKGDYIDMKIETAMQYILDEAREGDINNVIELAGTTGESRVISEYLRRR